MEKLAEEFVSNGTGTKFQRYLIAKSWWATNYVSDCVALEIYFFTLKNKFYCSAYRMDHIIVRMLVHPGLEPSNYPQFWKF